jgi:anti-sigma-K factor RskA
MDDDDRDALAAEYVLGTLSAEERGQADALLARDATFAETVRSWEHRLGELNVMVEAVEPAPDLWERIKTGIDGAERRSQAVSETIELGMQTEPPAEPAVSSNSVTEPGAEPSLQTVPDLLSETVQRSEEAKTETVDLASTLLPTQARSEFNDRLPQSPAPQTTPDAQSTGRDRDVGTWRGLAIAASAIAALLAGYIAIGQFAPGLLGRQQQATASAPKTASVPQLAVLQQEPTAPAFLVLLDPQQRTITVRRLTAAPDSGRSYELWLYSTKSAKPASLGAVGNSEVTSRPIPQNIDLDAMRSATYAVSLEPGSGSGTGAPTGPILFKGRMIETMPGSSG